MALRLVESGWDLELAGALSLDLRRLLIVCPFMKQRPLERLLTKSRPAAIQVITRFSLADFAEGVSDLGALRFLINCGAQVRGVRGLHAKLYVFGSSRSVITSANLTEAALKRNHEFGCVVDDPLAVAQCVSYFDGLWTRAGSDLTLARLDDWEARLGRYLAGGSVSKPATLGDEGVELGFAVDPPSSNGWYAESPQAFVKFLGSGNNRTAPDLATTEEIRRAGCHWALAYPRGKRPTGVVEGAHMFIGRLVRHPDDILVFGRAVALPHMQKRDDATSRDIALRNWKANWPHYIRVHHAEFVDGALSNGVSLNALMEALKHRSFTSTAEHYTLGRGNVDPRRAYRQQPAVRLASDGAAWLSKRLEAAFEAHGKVALRQVPGLDWPALPTP